ncbi:hypothetical protein GCM10009802_03540 [Streptomyces synnematoformans]|uniref:HIT domain-containing protein n=1 Tax=Streptomyces synnematoformans TaxID=415721 RepID=A0ABP5J0N6_9ACTN
MTAAAVQRVSDGLAEFFARLGPLERHCPFCKIVRGEEPATIVREWPHALAIVPLNPVVDGHLLVLPKRHVVNAAEDLDVTAGTARCAGELARETGNGNLITSIGPEATQTVFHLHWHVVPRAEGDGLHLPWTGQHTSKEPA